MSQGGRVFNYYVPPEDIDNRRPVRKTRGILKPPSPCSDDAGEGDDSQSDTDTDTDGVYVPDKNMTFVAESSLHNLGLFAKRIINDKERIMVCSGQYIKKEDFEKNEPAYETNAYLVRLTNGDILNGEKEHNKRPKWRYANGVTPENEKNGLLANSHFLCSDSRGKRKTKMVCELFAKCYIPQYAEILLNYGAGYALCEGVYSILVSPFGCCVTYLATNTTNCALSSTDKITQEQGGNGGGV
jgi:hypothetical protein